MAVSQNLLGRHGGLHNSAHEDLILLREEM